MKLVGIVQAYNEEETGHLRRCLDNLRRYCDAIVVYDDGSTDGTRDVALKHAEMVIGNARNDFLNETTHRQQLLDMAIRLDASHVFWLDADEVLDSAGTLGGLRELCRQGGAWDFEEVTLWRSTLWRRMDYLGKGRFIRLWQNNGRLEIPQERGLHRQLHPNGLGPVRRAPFRVLHYGYASRDSIERRWRQRSRLGVPVEIRRAGVDEREMELEPVPRGWFPPGVYVPTIEEPRPEPIRYADDIMSEAGL